MGTINFLLGCIIFVSLLLFIRNHYHVYIYSLDGQNNVAPERVLSIHDTNKVLRSSFFDKSTANLTELLRERDSEIRRLVNEIEALHYAQSRNMSPNSSYKLSNYSGRSDIITDLVPTKLQNWCESRFGLTLIENWRSNSELWCSESESESKDSNHFASRLTCYPHHQDHKKADGRGPDMFCVATNFVIDFSKVTHLGAM